MWLGLLVPVGIGAGIILIAVAGYQRRRRVQTRVCGDIRRMLADIAPLADPEVFESADPATAPEPAARLQLRGSHG